MPHQVPRADRVSVSVPISYRLTGDEEWFQTRLLNLSDSGLMFGPATLEPGARIEVLFALPFPTETSEPGRIIGSARVIHATVTGTIGARFDKRRYLIES